jgi:hypothetical protein
MSFKGLRIRVAGKSHDLILLHKVFYNHEPFIPSHLSIYLDSAMSSTIEQLVLIFV